MAEPDRLPQIRRTGEDTIIIADGTSGSQQSYLGAEREAKHVVQLLASAL